ncbi:MAG: L,D-transpeptidase family protein [Hyphomicrobiales bacterium]
MSDKLSRRGFLAGSAAAVSSMAGGINSANAETDPISNFLKGENLAEWNDGFDALSPAKKVRNFQPTLSPTSVVDIETSLRDYSGIVNNGGWNKVPTSTKLRLGARDESVRALRRRLAISKDLDGGLVNSTVFDSYVEAAVKNFQARHGMAVDGVIGQLTLAALNVPAEVRFRQLETNLVRLRSLSGYLGNRYVMVNVPAAIIETVSNGRIHSRHTAVVGKIDRQTPILNSKIYQVNFNPFWTVPRSIIRKDLIPVMQKDPQYLTKHSIRIFAPDGAEIPPTQVDWKTEEAVNYRFRQDPGEKNSLGQMRINFSNPHAVYLHDTPNKNLFGREVRFHSSGCVRVQNVREFVQWLLKDTDGWSRPNIDKTIKSGERTDANMAGAVPLYLTYVTAWGSPDGVVHFRDDVYNRDGLGPIALR